MLKPSEARMIELIQQEIRPAIGCTEPAAAAYAVAVARRALGCPPEMIHLFVSRSILKNAMGVGIPGTGMVGLPIAAALGAVCGDPDATLSVLHAVTPEAVQLARVLVEEQCVEIRLKQTDKNLYIEAQLSARGHTACVLIEDTHTRITLISVDGVALFEEGQATKNPESGTEPEPLSILAIDQFAHSVDWRELAFLGECVSINEAIAQDGLAHPRGLQVGKSLFDAMYPYRHPNDLADYAVALTCAASDARMGGSELPVMTSCGSGNQGLTATLPVIAVAHALKLSDEVLMRSLAYSLLITIHVKRQIGKLSPLCACGIGASIGVASALTFLGGGSLTQVCRCIQNVIADVSGIICDGAKAGCSLKIATGVTSAFRCSMLALRDQGAGVLDGIVGADAEDSIRNLGELGSVGMAQTDHMILDLLIDKQKVNTLGGDIHG